MTRERITPFIAMGLLALAGGCSQKEAADDAADSPVALVTLGRAAMGPIDQTVSVYGVTDGTAAATFALVAPSEAGIGTVDAPVGTAVVQGQAVIHLVPTPQTRQDAIKAAADATAADAAYARAKRLRGESLASDADVEAAASAARTADAALAAAQARDQALVLRAPQAGFVATLTQSPGDVVAAGTTLATIATTSNLRARFGVDPALAHRVAAGAAIHVVPANGEAFDAHVLSSSPVIDPQSHMASIVAAVPASAGLGGGDALRGEVTVASTAQALSIPYAALLDDGGQPYVFVVKGGVAHRTDVETGAHSSASGGDRIAVTKGLGEGDEVVTVGGTALDDGMKVRTK
jgi:RND family efflux transporter MFP subunit